MLAERHCHGREAGRVLAHLRIKERDAALGGVGVAHLAGKCREASERPGRRGVAARRRLVLPRLRPVKELLVARTGKEEAAPLAVLELLKEHIGKRARKFKVRPRELGLHELEQRSGQERVIVEIGIEVRAAVLVGRKQPAALPHARTNEIERTPGGRDPILATEYPAGVRHAADRKRIPGHQHLVIAARTNAPLARSKELVPRRFDQRLGRRRQAIGETQMPVLAFEVGRTIQAIAGREDRVFGGAEQRLHLASVPDVELAFHVLAIGIERRVVAAFGRLHLAHQPGGRLRSAARVQLLAAHQPRVGEQREQRPVVVQHLLEVRDRPFGIDAVAAKAAAELVVDAAFAHALESDERDVALALAQAELEIRRMRKLRRRAETASRGVEVGAQVAEHRPY